MKFINKDKINTGAKTWIVIGLARGGSSLPAGVCYHLGLYPGEQCMSPHYEDKALGLALRKRQNKKTHELIKNYNKKGTWFFKDPASNNIILDEHIDSFRNPVFIFLKKSPKQIANRWHKLGRKSFIPALVSVYFKYMKLEIKLLRYHLPYLKISYDELLSSPEFFIKEIAWVSGIDDLLCSKSANNYVSAGKQAYVDWFDRTNSPVLGFWDDLGVRHVRGWAFSKEKPSHMEITVKLNDRVLASGMANGYREDVRKADIGSEGYCGFKLNWSENLVTKEQIQHIEIYADGYKLMSSRPPPALPILLFKK